MRHGHRASSAPNLVSNSFFVKQIPYFFCYKTEFFSFQNNPKDLDPSYKMDLGSLGLFRKGKIGIIAKFHRTGLVI